MFDYTKKQRDEIMEDINTKVSRWAMDRRAINVFISEAHQANNKDYAIILKENYQHLIVKQFSSRDGISVYALGSTPNLETTTSSLICSFEYPISINLRKNFSSNLFNRNEVFEINRNFIDNFCNFNGSSEIENFNPLYLVDADSKTFVTPEFVGEIIDDKSAEKYKNYLREVLDSQKPISYQPANPFTIANMLNTTISESQTTHTPR